MAIPYGDLFRYLREHRIKSEQIEVSDRECKLHGDPPIEVLARNMTWKGLEKLAGKGLFLGRCRSSPPDELTTITTSQYDSGNSVEELLEQSSIFVFKPTYDVIPKDGTWHDVVARIDVVDGKLKIYYFCHASSYLR